MIDNRDGRIYLDAVLEKIRQRILSIDESLLEGQKEIDEMHEYYDRTPASHQQKKK